MPARRPAPVLLVLPCVRQGGDEAGYEALGECLARELRRRLDVTGHRTVSDESSRRVAAGLTSAVLGRPDVESLIAQSGADYVVHGHFRWSSAEVAFELTVSGRDGGGAPARARGKASAFQRVLDDAAWRVLRRVRGGPLGRSARRAMARTHTTNSAAAFLGLVRARGTARAGGDRDQLEREVRAVLAEDPSYAEPYQLLAAVARERGDEAGAVAALQEAARVHARAGRARERAAALLGVGWSLAEAGRAGEGLEAYDEAARLFDALGEPRGAAQARMNAANVHLQRGDLGRAIAAYEAGLARIEGYPEDRAKHAFNLGLALKEVGRLQEAAVRLEQARLTAIELRHEDLIASAYNALGTVYMELGELESAVNLLRRAEEHLDGAADPLLLASVKDHLGIVLKRQGRLEDALEASEQACRLFEGRGDPVHLAVAWVNRAAILLALERGDEAGPLLERAHRTFVAEGSPSATTTRKMLEELRGS